MPVRVEDDGAAVEVDTTNGRLGGRIHFGKGQTCGRRVDDWVAAGMKVFLILNIWQERVMKMIG